MAAHHATESVVHVPLSNGGFAIVDAADAELVLSRRWHGKQRRKQSPIYAYTTSRRLLLAMHRLVAGATPGLQVDHRDRDGLNNRRSNLRLCTNAQNQWNRVKVRGGSQYKGVNRCGRKWRAVIRVDGQQVHLGYFRVEEEAAKAYDAAAVQLFGEFARLNF